MEVRRNGHFSNICRKSTSPSSAGGNNNNNSKRSSGRLRDPEFAAKHKAFLQKVTVAENGSMESYLRQESTNKEDGMEPGKAETAAPGQKRPAAASPPGQEAPAKKRKNSRTSSSGQVGRKSNNHIRACS